MVGRQREVCPRRIRAHEGEARRACEWHTLVVSLSLPGLPSRNPVCILFELLQLIYFGIGSPAEGVHASVTIITENHIRISVTKSANNTHGRVRRDLLVQL